MTGDHHVGNLHRQIANLLGLVIIIISLIIQRTYHYVYRVSFRRCRPRPLKLPLNCEVIEKGSFGAFDLYGEGLPQISDVHFKSPSLPSTWPVLLSSVQRAGRVADE